MPMTDAPNFGTKFGRRKPCLRYIGPLLHTTSVAPVGRGDHTPPSVHSRSPRWQGPSSRQFSVGSERLPHRVGADLCVRPRTGPAKNCVRADTQVGPYRSYRKPPSPPAPMGGQGFLIPWGRTGRHARPLTQKQRDVSRETSRCPADLPWMQGLGLYAGPGGEGAVIAPLPSAGRLPGRGGTGRSGPPRRRSADPSADPGLPGPPRGGSEPPRRPPR